MLARRQAELRIVHRRDCVTEKVVTHPAPCLSRASRSQLCPLRFLWQRVKLSRGLRQVVETTRPIETTLS